MKCPSHLVRFNAHLNLPLTGIEHRKYEGCASHRLDDNMSLFIRKDQKPMLCEPSRSLFSLLREEREGNRFTFL